MNKLYAITKVLLVSAVLLSLTGCAQLSQLGLGAKKPAAGGTAAQGGGKEAGPGGAATPGQSARTLTGDWQVAFQYKNQTMKSTIHLKQDGNQFSGQGTDDESGRQFSISDGEISGNKLEFFKKYEVADSSTAPPVDYGGEVDLSANPPYMSGKYVANIQGEEVTGMWEAEMQPPAGAAPQGEQQAQGGATAPGSQPGAPAAPVTPDKPPHLSGKWNVGYEYNFKTIRSVMFLEEDGGKLTGHGVDQNTREKFVIEKGWYNFPRVTIIRKYEKGKGAAADRTMTFKAQVSVVNDKEYQGPYMGGKTDGGGAWEAQQER